MSGKTARRAKCAELRRVCGICVVTGAPHKTWIAARAGMETRERMEAMIPVCISYITNLVLQLFVRENIQESPTRSLISSARPLLLSLLASHLIRLLEDKRLRKVFVWSQEESSSQEAWELDPLQKLGIGSRTRIGEARGECW